METRIPANHDPAPDEIGLALRIVKGARILVVGSALGAIVVVIARSLGRVEAGSDAAMSPATLLAAGLFFLAAQALHLGDLRNGSVAACRGMIVGGVGSALWLASDWVRVLSGPHLGLALLGAVAELLGGVMAGGLIGAAVGRLSPAIRQLVRASRRPGIRLPDGSTNPG